MSSGKESWRRPLVLGLSAVAPVALVAIWLASGGTEEAPAPVLLFFHGNAGNMGDRLMSLETFHALGLSVLMIDYRGYGLSTGRPTEKGTELDALAAWNYLTAELAVPPQRIIVFGRSQFQHTRPDEREPHAVCEFVDEQVVTNL